MKKGGIALATLCIVFLGVFVFSQQSEHSIPPPTLPIATTTDHSVPPKPTPSPMGTVIGKVELSPICPVERNPPDPNCAPKPYKTSIQIKQGNAATSYKSVESDASGMFYVSLAPGTYTFTPIGGSYSLPRCSDVLVTVVAGKTQNVTLECDTGIR